MMPRTLGHPRLSQTTDSLFFLLDIPGNPSYPLDTRDIDDPHQKVPSFCEDHDKDEDVDLADNWP